MSAAQPNNDHHRASRNLGKLHCKSMNPDLHKVLTRQINKVLGDSPQLSPELVQLLERVSDTYKQFDGDHKLIERSLEISSNEMMAINKTIEATVAQRTEELRQEHVRFAASINSLSLGFIMCDTVGKVIMMNPKVRDILQSELQAPGQPVAVIKQVNEWTFQEIDNLFGDINLTKSLKTAIEAGRAVEAPEVVYHNRALRLLMSPIISNSASENTNLGTVLVVEDITERKVMERSRDEFFSIASHELRTPLTAIRGNTSMMQKYYAEQLKDPDLKSMIEDINESSVRLIDIVNDFLDLSRLEQGKLSFTPELFDLKEVVGSVLYEMQSVASPKNIKLIADSSVAQIPAVMADKARIKQVIYNLVGNGLKFTEAGNITLSASTENQFAVLSFTDTGRGISGQNQQLLFRKFQQASDSLITRDTTKGTGLGLYISKLIVERSGGSIRLERSDLNVGSTFSIRLPLALATVESQQPVSAQSAAQ